jgi:hypothetical protein
VKHFFKEIVMQKYIIIVIAVVMLVSSSLCAATNWTEASGADHLWSTAGNWDSGVPTATVDAAVALAGQPVQITTGINAETSMLNIGGAGGQVDMTGGTLNGGVYVLVAQGATTATFNQSGGTATGGTVFIADYGGTGVMNLSGTATFIATGNLLAGARGTGTGTLNMTDSAHVQSPYIAIGQQNTGNLTMSGNATMAIGDQVWLGIDGIGTANISGSASITSSSIVWVGYASGSGTLNISGTATVSGTGHILVGYGAFGDGTVNMTGGLLNSHMFDIGTGGAGHIQLDGGTVRVGPGGLVMHAGNASIDITGSGALIVPGEWNALSPYISGGMITANGGAGTLAYSLADGYTTITAIPEPATMILLGLGALVLRRRK